MGEEIDEIDRKILKLLKKDARMSFSEIARQFGFSDVAIKKRVDKLVDKGVIKKFTAVLDREKLGKSVSAFIFLKTRSNKVNEVAEKLLDSEPIEDVFVSMGVYDIIAKAYCQDVPHFKEFTEDKLNNINGILESRPSIVVSEIKEEED